MNLIVRRLIVRVYLNGERDSLYLVMIYYKLISKAICCLYLIENIWLSRAEANYGIKKIISCNSIVEALKFEPVKSLPLILLHGCFSLAAYIWTCIIRKIKLCCCIFSWVAIWKGEIIVFFIWDIQVMICLARQTED